MVTEAERTKQKLFRITEEEDAKLQPVIEYAHKAGYIKASSFQEFMIFAINCAYTRLKHEYEQSRGRRIGSV